jgi:hypothetical protein
METAQLLLEAASCEALSKLLDIFSKNRVTSEQPAFVACKETLKQKGISDTRRK